MYDPLRHTSDGFPITLGVNLWRSSVLFYPASRRIVTPLYLSFSPADELPFIEPANDAALSLAGPGGRSVDLMKKCCSFHGADVLAFRAQEIGMEKSACIGRNGATR